MEPNRGLMSILMVSVIWGPRFTNLKGWRPINTPLGRWRSPALIYLSSSQFLLKMIKLFKRWTDSQGLYFCEFLFLFGWFAIVVGEYININRAMMGNLSILILFLFNRIRLLCICMYVFIYLFKYYSSNTFILYFDQAQKVEREASELKGTMHKRMDFLDMD